MTMNASPTPQQPEPRDTTLSLHTVRKRTRARELALRALYMIDIRSASALTEVPAFFESETDDGDVRGFAELLFEGCLSCRAELDARIAQVAENWEIHRMAVVDRNILRLGTYELMFLDAIPPKVSINEAIDLAKKYSTADSGAFVNGILDKLRTQLRPDSANSAEPTSVNSPRQDSAQAVEPASAPAVEPDKPVAAAPEADEEPGAASP